MGEGREPEPQLVGGHPTRAGAVGKEVLLRLLDAVFHFFACAVKLLVERGAAKQPSAGRFVTTKRGLCPLSRISALPTTRRARLQFLRVRYSKCSKRRQGA